MRSKTNISVRNNQGAYTNTHMIIGANGRFASGDILDANATVDVIENEFGQPLIEDLDTIRSGAAAGATALQPADITTLESNVEQNTTNISGINDVIPAQATSSNQLADKNFVNSSVSTNTAEFKGTYVFVTDLNSDMSNLGVAINDAGYSAANDNDYCFIVSTDADGNTVYNRYKHTVVNNVGSWSFEYSLNNSSFTSNQWESIQSGITSNIVSKLSALPTNSDLTSSLNSKQATLVSGTNIKTINNTTVLGSGNFNLVESTDVKHVVVLTQAQYDALSTKDAYTEYNII